MLRRHLAWSLLRAAREMPVLTLHGPRQSGKTTLAKAVFPRYRYATLEDPAVRARALDDPRAFLRDSSAGMILDEVHRAPEILSFIQGIVDEHDRPGMFVLTSSQNLMLLRDVSQSLAGRTAILRLLPFSTAELMGWRRRPPAAIFGPRTARGPSGPPWDSLWRGFFPRVRAGRADPRAWASDYVRTYVERDVREVLRISDLRTFQRFLVAVAARTAQEVNLSDLASDVGITHPTASAWIAALEASSLVALLPCHAENYGRLIRKRPKLHVLDTGLACSLLGIASAVMLERHPLRGAIFESYVAGEILKTLENARETPRLFHWREAKGHEVDFIVQTGDAYLPVEAKSGETYPSDAAEPVRRWLGVARAPDGRGVVVHGGRDSFNARGIEVRPWWGA